MQFFAIIAAFAAVAAAAPDSPPPGGQQCKPATYSCLPNSDGWQVCNTGGQWVVSLELSSTSKRSHTDMFPLSSPATAPPRPSATSTSRTRAPTASKHGYTPSDRVMEHTESLAHIRKGSFLGFGVLFMIT